MHVYLLVANETLILINNTTNKYKTFLLCIIVGPLFFFGPFSATYLKLSGFVLQLHILLILYNICLYLLFCLRFYMKYAFVVVYLCKLSYMYVSNVERKFVNIF